MRVGSASALDNEGARVQSEKALQKAVGPEFGFDLSQIGRHYEHRRQLRKAHSVLRSGKVIPLLAKHRHSPQAEHERVLAFARFSY